MKRKELKNIAIKIAKLEQTVQTTTDKEAAKRAEMEIMKLSESVHSLEDMVLIDEMVMDILEK